MNKIVFVICLLLAGAAHGEPDYPEESKIPPEVRGFILPGTRLLALEAADLNGDGRSDYLVVLEKPDQEEEQRPLLILVRSADGTLSLAKQNNRVVYCSTCGGMMGDPFQGVKGGKNTFTVSHYGGSAWRWSTEATFNYSRKDRTWQLVMVQEDSFHASEPDNVSTKRYRPPRDYGKIDISQFDPDTYLKKRR